MSGKDLVQAAKANDLEEAIRLIDEEHVDLDGIFVSQSRSFRSYLDGIYKHRMEAPLLSSPLETVIWR